MSDKETRCIDCGRLNGWITPDGRCQNCHQFYEDE